MTEVDFEILLLSCSSLYKLDLVLKMDLYNALRYQTTLEYFEIF